MVDIELIGRAVALLGPEAGEAVDCGVAVGAFAPGASGAPGELCPGGGLSQRGARAEQGVDVYAIVDGTVGDGHRILLYVCG